MEELLLANAAIALLETLLPRLEKLRLTGAITPEQQQAVHDRYQALRAQGSAAFKPE